MRSDSRPLGRCRKASGGVLLPPSGASWNTREDVYSRLPGLPCPSSGLSRRTTFLLTQLTPHPRAVCSVPRATPTSRTVGDKMALRSKVNPTPGIQALACRSGKCTGQADTMATSIQPSGCSLPLTSSESRTMTPQLEATPLLQLLCAFPAAHLQCHQARLPTEPHVPSVCGG